MNAIKATINTELNASSHKRFIRVTQVNGKHRMCVGKSSWGDFQEGSAEYADIYLRIYIILTTSDSVLTVQIR